MGSRACDRSRRRASNNVNVLRGDRKDEVYHPGVPGGTCLDNRSSLYLSRLDPPGMGRFIVLTGYKANGAECLHYGLATHFVSTDARNALTTRLSSSRGFTKALDELLNVP